MIATATWGEVTFEAHPESAKAYDNSTYRQLNILTCICHTSNGYIYRGSAGEYPWSSAVILATKVNDKLSCHAYPTEINPVGELEVNCDELEIMLKLKPRFYLMKEPLFNPMNGCYQWEIFIEGHPVYSKKDAVELGEIRNSKVAWECKNRKVKVILNKSTSYIWAEEGFEKYLYLAEKKLEQLRSAPVIDEWDDQEYDLEGYDFDED